MTLIEFPQFHDQYENTNYPFADGLSLTNNAGYFIGQGIFLDAAFYVIGGGARLYLSQIDITNDTATLWVGDNSTPQLASASFDLLAPPDTLRFVDQFGRPAGMLLSTPTNLITFASWTAGTHQFQITQTEFVATVCMPTPESGVRGIKLEDGSVLTGDVWLVGDDGIVLSPGVATFDNPTGGLIVQPTIRVDIVGDPLFRRRLCNTPSLFVSPQFIKELVVQQGTQEFTLHPDAFGNISITTGSAVDTVLRITPTDHSLVFQAVGPSA